MAFQFKFEKYVHSHYCFYVILCIILYLCTQPSGGILNVRRHILSYACALYTFDLKSLSADQGFLLIIFTKTFFFSEKHQKTRCYLWVLKTFISNINFLRENREPCLRSRPGQLLLCSLILSRISLLVNVR